MKKLMTIVGFTLVLCSTSSFATYDWQQQEYLNNQREMLETMKRQEQENRMRHHEEQLDRMRRSY